MFVNPILAGAFPRFLGESLSESGYAGCQDWHDIRRRAELIAARVNPKLNKWLVKIGRVGEMSAMPECRPYRKSGAHIEYTPMPVLRLASLISARPPELDALEAIAS